MTDEGPQGPPRGRRARGSADPEPGYPGDLPRRAYPSPQYPEAAPGRRRRAAPGDRQAAPGYPAPPGHRGRLAGDAAPGHGRAAPPGEPAAGYDPRTPAGESSSGYDRAAPADYGRGGSPGEAPRGYDRTGAPGQPAPRRSRRPDETAGGYGRPGGSGLRGPYDPGQDTGGGDAGGRDPGPGRGRRRRGDSLVPPGGSLPGGRSVPPGGAGPAGRSVPRGGPGVDGYLTAPLQQSRLDEVRSGRAGQVTEEPPAADWASVPPRGRRHRPEPHPEAGPAPAVRDRPAERTGPSRHRRAPGDSGVGWDSALETGPRPAPAAGPAGGARAASGRAASGWSGSGPIPPGRRPPEAAAGGRGGPAGSLRIRILILTTGAPWSASPLATPRPDHRRSSHPRIRGPRTRWARAAGPAAGPRSGKRARSGPQSTTR